MGYQEKEISAGFSLVTPMFQDVGKDGFNLKNLKLSDDAAGDGSEQIQILGADGRNTGIWVWLNDNVGMTPGWYDNETWSPVEQNIPAAVGYLMNVSASVRIIVAGQVKASQTTVSIPRGFSVRGNDVPSDIDIQSFKLSDDAAGDGSEQIQILGADGRNTGIWVWLNDNVGMTPGWYDNETWSPVESTVKPGEAFLFNCSADIEMTIPAAF